MSTGQLLFYGGAALLAVTILLAIFFLIKKPRYTPESTYHAGAEISGTQRLQNAYPTDPATLSRSGGKRRSERRTAKLAGSQTETALLGQETASMARGSGTALLNEATGPVSRETALLEENQDEPYTDGRQSAGRG